MKTMLSKTSQPIIKKMLLLWEEGLSPLRYSGDESEDAAMLARLPFEALYHLHGLNRSVVHICVARHGLIESNNMVSESAQIFKVCYGQQDVLERGFRFIDILFKGII